MAISIIPGFAVTKSLNEPPLVEAYAPYIVCLLPASLFSLFPPPSLPPTPAPPLAVGSFSRAGVTCFTFVRHELGGLETFKTAAKKAAESVAGLSRIKLGFSDNFYGYFRVAFMCLVQFLKLLRGSDSFEK